MSDASITELDRDAVLKFFFDKSMAGDELKTTYQAVASIIFGHQNICEYTNGLFYIHIEVLDDERRKIDLPVLLEKLKSIVRKLEAKEKQTSEININHYTSPKIYSSKNLESSPSMDAHSEPEIIIVKTENNSPISQNNFKRSVSHDSTAHLVNSTVANECPSLIRSNSSNQVTTNSENKLKRDASQPPSPQKKKEPKISEPPQIERVKARRPFADPKIRLHFSPLNPIAASFKVARKDITDDGKVIFLIRDVNGKNQKITVRQASKVPKEIERFEHKRLASSCERDNSLEEINELMALTSDLTDLSVSQNGSSILGMDFLKLSPLPIKSNSSMIKDPTRACYICKQLYKCNIITCTNCKLSAHKNCLPDDDIAQEWVNEQEECHYCTEYKNSNMLFIKGNVQKEFIVITRGKVMGFNVSLIEASLESNGTKMTNSFPIQWIRALNPHILDNI